MNKLSQLVVSAVASLTLFSGASWADAATDLQTKLQKVAKFSASFSQQVLDIDGTVIQQASGEMKLAQPDQFRWQVKQPDEELVVSNGSTVWIYSPFVEQVTLLDQADAVAGTPFLLLASTDASVWQQYDVSQADTRYIVKPKDDEANIAEFSLNFDAQDQLVGFSIKERQGQTSEFELSNLNLAPTLANSDFEFVIPAGVEVDDQR
ncbi:outer membrane lipoprotein chaperone LolA [Motilimonas eburnea]|uniref:outer membrane lipoprotein chaperone LolA n=1 Tax=Motilimonas eburnea TaxID=1737488 RepID=UPI001E5EA1AC|nr:outer membrane lipoprotein chaperone LolA [Motilimonas eburnea]MCE2573189.1 outer membrane lipoprotein chaperone LolA [Motilimonas eburnea]